MPRITVTIDETNARTLIDLADRKRLDGISALLKHLAFNEIKKEGFLPAVPKEKQSTSNNLYVRMTDEEKKAFSDLAYQDGISENSYVRILVGTAINNQPHFTDKELEELRKSRNELSAIGRNLNQYVRAVNEGRGNLASLPVNFAKKLSEQSSKVTKKIGGLIRKCQRRIVDNG